MTMTTIHSVGDMNVGTIQANHPAVRGLSKSSGSIILGTRLSVQHFASVLLDIVEIFHGIR